MNREWATFWAAMAVIAASGAATVYAALGKPWEIGSLGEWVSGIMAGAAIVAALHIANEEARRTRVAAEEAAKAEVARLKAETLGNLQRLIIDYAFWFGNMVTFYAGMRDNPTTAAAKARNLKRMKAFEKAEHQILSANLSGFSSDELNAYSSVLIDMNGLETVFSLLADLSDEAADRLTADIFDGAPLGPHYKNLLSLLRALNKRGGSIHDLEMPWEMIGLDVSEFT